MKEALKIEIMETFDALIKVHTAFREQDIDKVPFEGSWTPGQVAEHIVKSVGNMNQFLNEKTEATQRPFDEKCLLLRKIFLDFNSKMKSPDFIQPLDVTHNKALQLQQFTQFKEKMLQAVESLDLSLTCKSLELPNLGFLTRLEWLTFFITHTQRHTHQLEKIYEVVCPNA